MLHFDTTPPAAVLPATQASSASASAPKQTAAAAFDELLALLSGTAEPPRKGSASPNAIGIPPFAFAAPAAGVVGPAVARGRAPGRAIEVTDATLAGEAELVDGDDDQALADNLKWLLAMASMPKPEALPAVPAGTEGDVPEETATAISPFTAANVTSNTSVGSPADAGDVPGLLPRVPPSIEPAADVDVTALPGVSVRAESHQADKTAPVRMASPNSDPVPFALPTVTAADDALVATQIIEAPAAHESAASHDGPVSPRTASPSSDARTPAAELSSALTVTVPSTPAESRAGDGGASGKRSSHGPDDRHGDAAQPKAAVPAQSTVVFQPSEEHRVAAPAVAEIAAASRPETAADVELPRQIVHAIRMQWADGVGDARITLKPEYLGELSIAIRVEQGSVTAALQASSASVREWIEGNQQTLRHALAEHGLELDRLTVTEESAQPEWSGGEHEERRQQHEEARQAQRPRRRENGDASTFELVA